MIRIQNDGIQIPLENRPILFHEKFNEKKEGKGIGLTIVQKIVKAL